MTEVEGNDFNNALNVSCILYENKVVMFNCELHASANHKRDLICFWIDSCPFHGQLAVPSDKN